MKARKTIERLDAKVRKKQLLDIAIELSQEIGYQRVGRRMIAERANVSTPLISAHFGSIHKLQKLIMQAAIKHRILIIVAQGLVARDKIALSAPDELKQAAMQLLIQK